MSLFKLRGELTRTQSIVLGLAGLIFILALWWILAESFSRQIPIVENYTKELPIARGADSLRTVAIRDSIILSDSLAFANATEFKKTYPTVPLPTQVVAAFPDLVQEDNLFYNAWRSVWLNIRGYFWAIFFSIPLGFLIGLLPMFRGMFSKPVDALRYLPLAALIGLFIQWFGFGDEMKVAFLAFGILVYLLPVVAQRINEVNDVYTKTVFTLAATDWQTIKTVFLPSVMSKVIDDIRVLTAISWTYIIFAEYLNREGGLGALIYIKRRLGQVPDLFALLLVIILIGFIQDRLFVYLDKRLFPHKYYKTTLPGLLEIKYGIWAILGILTLLLLPGKIYSMLSSFIFLIAGKRFPEIDIGMNTITLITVLGGVIFILFGEVKLQGALRK